MTQQDALGAVTLGVVWRRYKPRRSRERRPGTRLAQGDCVWQQSLAVRLWVAHSPGPSLCLCLPVLIPVGGPSLQAASPQAEIGAAELSPQEQLSAGPWRLPWALSWQRAAALPSAPWRKDALDSVGRLQTAASVVSTSVSQGRHGCLLPQERWGGDSRVAGSPALQEASRGWHVWEAPLAPPPLLPGTSPRLGLARGSLLPKGNCRRHSVGKAEVPGKSV